MTTVPTPETPAPSALRLDKWLWFARFVKTRSQAQRLIESGDVTVNGSVAAKTGQMVRIGDRIGFPTGRRRRLVRLASLGSRRGGAPDAALLYLELPAPSVWDEE